MQRHEIQFFLYIGNLFFDTNDLSYVTLEYSISQ